MIRSFLHHGLSACLFVLTVLPAATALAALPEVLNHQGRIAVNGVNFDGNGLFKFALVNANGSITYWSNDASSLAGAEPASAVTLTVSKGLYSVRLGDTALANMGAIALEALEQADVHLRVWFNDGTHGFQQITPDQSLAAVPYAIHANKALAAGSFSGPLEGDVTGAQNATAIADATVTGKRLTGFSSGTGSVSGSDSLLTAIGKLDGNSALKAPLDSPSFTGTVVMPAGTTSMAPVRLTRGTNLASPVVGAVEFDGSQLYLTTSSSTRKTLAFADGVTGELAAENLTAAPLSPVVAWGSNSESQSSVPLLSEVAAVAAGSEHSLALLQDGTVQAWGSNASGQVTVPGGLSGVSQIAAGLAHNVVCKSDGSVVAWGAASYNRTAVPGGLTSATDVAAGSLHSLALLADGSVLAWGDSTFNQATVPDGLIDVISIAAGEYHSLALKRNGEVLAWGSNAIGQTNVPESALSGVIAIAAGFNHNLALKSDGSVLAWGLNNGGQTNVPEAASAGVVQIAAGDTFSLALKSDGTVVAWGFTAEADPVTVIPGNATQVTEIAAGGAHALALRSDSVPVQFARLDYLGRLGIGRSPATNVLEVEGRASKSTAGSWLANSDRRIKTGIQPITGALETLARVRLVDFRYTSAYLATHPVIEDRRYPNVIAQEFAEIFPSDVKESGEIMPDGSSILQVDTYPLTIYSAAAIQELHRENNALKEQVAAQERRLRKLEEAVSRFEQ
jgi:hypothetical protein